MRNKKQKKRNNVSETGLPTGTEWQKMLLRVRFEVGRLMEGQILTVQLDRCPIFQSRVQ